MREEVIGLVITALLLNVEVDSSEVVEESTKMLDDPWPNVCSIAIEAFEKREKIHKQLFSPLKISSTRPRC
jgi:hypothetical protein